MSCATGNSFAVFNTTINQLLGLLYSCIKACAEHKSVAWSSVKAPIEFLLHGFIEDYHLFMFLFTSLWMCLLYSWPYVLVTEFHPFSILAGPGTMQRAVLVCFAYASPWMCTFAQLTTVKTAALSHQSCLVCVSNFSDHLKSDLTVGN